jgi:hypothetical protein
MTNYAVVKDGVVINTIVADSKDIAESVVGETCIEFEDLGILIGSTYDGTRFIDPQPYPSWTLNSEYKWEAPVAQPKGPENEDPTVRYEWNEEDSSWDEFPL